MARRYPLVRVRIGLHAGEAELTADGYIGMDVHHAARIMGAAHGGQILLSQTMRDLVEQHLPAAHSWWTWESIASRTYNGPATSFN